jgi:hypothetical protein
MCLKCKIISEDLSLGCYSMMIGNYFYNTVNKCHLALQVSFEYVMSLTFVVCLEKVVFVSCTAASRNLEFVSLQPSCGLVIMVAA